MWKVVKLSYINEWVENFKLDFTVKVLGLSSLLCGYQTNRKKISPTRVSAVDLKLFNRLHIWLIKEKTFLKACKKEWSINGASLLFPTGHVCVERLVNSHKHANLATSLCSLFSNKLWISLPVSMYSIRIPYQSHLLAYFSLKGKRSLWDHHHCLSVRVPLNNF